MTRRIALATLALALSLITVTYTATAAQRAVGTSSDPSSVLDAFRAYQDDTTDAQRAVLVTTVQTYGDDATERILDFLDRLRAHVVQLGVTEERRDALRGTVDSVQSAVISLQDRLDELDPVTATIEHVRSFINDFRSTWEERQQDLRQVLHAVQLTPVAEIVTQLDDAVNRFVRTVEERRDAITDDATLDREVNAVVTLRDQALVHLYRLEDQLDVDDATFRASLSDTLVVVQQTKEALQASVATFGLYLREQTTTGVSLLAHGSGRAFVTLTGHVDVFLGQDADVFIEYHGGTQVEPVGAGSREPQGGGERLSGFSSVRIDGADLAVTVTGSDYAVRASGTGAATLWGSGTYRTQDDADEQRILPDGVDVSLVLEALP